LTHLTAYYLPRETATTGRYDEAAGQDDEAAVVDQDNQAGGSDNWWWQMQGARYGGYEYGGASGSG